MTGGHEFSPQLLALYDQAEMAWHRISSGPLPEQTLLVLVAMSNSVKIEPPEPTIWDRVELHTPVIVDTSGNSPYAAEFIRKQSNGRIEIRELSSDDHKKTVLERFVSLANPPHKTKLDWPQKLWSLERGDRVQWAPDEGEVSEVKFHGFENGKVQIKAGKGLNRNEYVDLSEIVILETVESS